jgi:hypothetical protein
METSTGHVWTFSRLPLSCPFVLEIAVPSSMMSYLPIFNKSESLCKGESSYSLLGAICGNDNVIADALTIQSDSASE